MRFFLLCLTAPLWSAVNQNNDVQLWVTEAVHKEISPSCSFHLYNEWRIGDDISRLYLFYLQGIVGFKVNEWMELGPGYRQIWSLAGADWRLTYEPLAELIVRKKKGRCEFQFRNRVSYLVREKDRNLWQYRGRIRWFAAWEVRNRICRPYLSNEIIFRSDEGFTQDRIMAGMIVPLINQLDADLYYMLRFQERNEHWTHQHVLGCWLNFNF